jgi:hypothetical protein
LAKVTLVFAALLIALGLAGFLGTGSAHYTALIPAAFGLILGLFGYLAMSPDESRRKLCMHVNVTVALLGFLAGGFLAVKSGLLILTAFKESGLEFQDFEMPMNAWFAFGSKAILAVLLLIYVILCVRSFIAARRSGKV